MARADLAAIVGVLALLEGLIQARRIDDDTIEAFGARLRSDGLAHSTDDRDVRQALNDLNHRVRYALGEYDEAPTRVPSRNGSRSR